MKSSALALLTAAALMFSATSVSFAQDTTTAPASDAECEQLAATDAEATGTVAAAGTAAAGTVEVEDADETANSSLTADEDDDDNVAEESEGDAIDDQTPPDCPAIAN